MRFEPLGTLLLEARSGFASGDRADDGIAQVRMNNINADGSWDWSRVIRVPTESIDVEKFMLEPGDVLFNNTNSQDLVGKTALFTGYKDLITFSNHFTRLRTGPELDARYLALWLHRQWQSGYFFRASTRWVGQAALGTKQLLALNVPLPELVQQRRIAAEVTAQLAAINGATAAASTRVELARSLRARAYDLAFEGGIPLSTRVGSFSPVGWSWRLLTDFARLETGHTPSRTRPDWWGGDVPWIALPDIRGLDGKITFGTIERTNAEGIANSSARILPTGTVVLSRTASVGFVTRMGRPMATSQDFVNWVCEPGIDPEFLMHLLIRSRDEIRALSSGAIHKTVYFPTVKAFQVCVPEIGEQRRIAAELRDQLAVLDAMEASIRMEREAIEALPSALLRRAFDGLAA